MCDEGVFRIKWAGGGRLSPPLWIDDAVNRCLSDFGSGGNLVQLCLKKPGKTINSN